LNTSKNHQNLDSTTSQNAGQAANAAADSIGADLGRSIFGGALMGLANLVPGISGGTMLLAAGVYPKFISAVAEITTFRFRFRSLLVLCCVGFAAALCVLIFAGFLKDLVVNQRWIMFSLFIGLTLGGLPIVYRLAAPLDLKVVVSALAAFALMAGFAVLQELGYVAGGNSNFFTLILAGLAGASAMILPGLSGGYILLLMGQYVPILGAVEQFKEALSERDFSAAWQPAITVIVPVGIGVVIGIVAISNLLKYLLKHQPKATLGVLLGLLLGSVVSLWPFKEYYQPELGQTVKGEVVSSKNIDEIDEVDWPTRRFSPSVVQAGCSLGLIGIGIAVTLAVGKIGGKPSMSSGDSERGG